MSGIIASEVANRSMRHPETWLEPADFMPSLEKKQKTTQAPKRMTRSRRAAVADATRAFFGPLVKS